MSQQLQLRRDTATNIAGFTPAQGEVLVDTTNHRLTVGDGATAGGWPVSQAIGGQMYTVPVRSVNLNSTGDTNVVIPLPAGFTRYAVVSVRVVNASVSLTAAKIGIYTAASQGGVALLAQTALSGITSASANVANDMATLTPIATAYLTNSSIYLNVGTAQGSAATADISIQIIPLS